MASSGGGDDVVETQRTIAPRSTMPQIPTGGMLSSVETTRASIAARKAHLPLSRWLMNQGMPRSAMELTLAAYYGCPFFHPDARTTIPESLRKQLRPDFLRRICAVPIEHRSTHIVVVMEDPSDLAATDQLLAMAGKAQLLIRIGLREDILAVIDAVYSGGAKISDILVQLDDTEEARGDVIDEAATIDEADSAVIKLANQLIIDGVRRGASDIHVEPNGADRPMSVRLRIDGDCVAYQDVPARFRRALVARLKIMARLDIAERRKPQDGKIRFLVGERTIELRVASYPSGVGDEDVVMRILPDGKPIALSRMQLSPYNYEALRGLVQRPYGLVLCVGPTGSGKTTTLHSALAEINKVDLKICTAEDPIEITQPGLRQLQVQPRIGLTFEVALRSFLRADPDVIMIGEMRDRETAQIAVEASLTGHLVLSTLHTNSAPETITRLLDMGLDPFTFADSLLGVLAQRLTPALCPDCRERAPLDGEEHAKLEEVAVGCGMTASREPPWRAKGCARCHDRGYRGRVALHELLVVDAPFRQAMGRRRPIEELRALAVSAGLRTLLQDGVEKARRGLTDLTQVLAVCSR